MKKHKLLSVTFSAFLMAALASAPTCSRGPAAASSLPVQNLRTLAKLYGYLRYIHPSDEAAEGQGEGRGHPRSEGD